MNNKKILIISIIVVIVAILIIGGITLAVAYTKTDMFKTDEQLFYKYFIQFSESIGDLKSEKLKEYLNKLEKTPYENKGKLSVRVDMPESEKAKITNLSKVNGFNITFSGKTDKINKLSEQSIKLNYSDEVNFPIEYKQTENLYGITSELILKQYIAIKADNLQETIKNENISEISNINIEDIKDETQKFIEIIVANLNENNFSKIDEENFALTLNEKETAKILLEILTEMEKIENIPENVKEQINKWINENKKKEYTEEENLRIIINKAGRLLIRIKNEININIQKINNELIIEGTTSENENKTIIKIRKNRR